MKAKKYLLFFHLHLLECHDLLRFFITRHEHLRTITLFRVRAADATGLRS